MCYLATFVFGINSIGLVLYSGQLLFNSISGDSINDGENKSDGQSGSSDSTVESAADSIESSSGKKDQSSDKTQWGRGEGEKKLVSDEHIFVTHCTKQEREKRKWM